MPTLKLTIPRDVQRSIALLALASADPKVLALVDAATVTCSAKLPAFGKILKTRKTSTPKKRKER